LAALAAFKMFEACAFHTAGDREALMFEANIDIAVPPASGGGVYREVYDARHRA
jgi:hypothetical protein